MQKNSTGKALLFAVLAGIVASMSVALIVSSFPAAPFRARNDAFFIAMIVPATVGWVYRNFKTDLKIFDRVIVVVLSLVLAYSGFQLGITRFVGNPVLRRAWVDAGNSPFFAAMVVFVAISSTVASRSSWGYGYRGRRGKYLLDRNFDRHED